MTAPRRKPSPASRKLAAVPSPTAPRVIAKPTPVDAADASVGRKVREFLEWTLQWVMWCVSGLLTVVAYRTYPDAGLWGAVAVDAVAGLLFILLLVRASR